MSDFGFEIDDAITTESVKDKLQELLVMVPGAHRMIAVRTKKFIPLRVFWKEVCQESHDWDDGLTKTDVRRFFKDLGLETFYTKHAQKRYSLLREIYDDLHTCISESALALKYAKFPPILKKIPEVASLNKDRVEHALLACRAYIEINMHDESKYTVERSRQLETIFKVLHRHFMRIASDLPSHVLEDLE